MLGSIIYSRKPVPAINIQTPLRALLWSTMAAGTALLAVVLLINWWLQGKGPIDSLLWVASGLAGDETLEGGWLTALGGLLFHFSITFSFVWLFFILYPLVSVAHRHKWMTGSVYGGLVWAFMYFVVLPVSDASMQDMDISFVLLTLAAHIAAFGWPVAFIMGLHHDQKDGKAAYARELFDPESFYYS